MTNENFYAECAAILGVEHQGSPFPYYKRTRWNNRAAGQGRFEGSGIIRVFGDNVHIALNNPQANGIFPSKDAALEFLRNITQ